MAYEMPSIDGLMRGAGRVRKSGYEILWGVGRHGPGSNVFSYFVEPNGFVTEYTTEVEQVDDSYVGHDADWWKAQNLFPCRWNMASAPTEFARKAMSGQLYEEENQRCEQVMAKALGADVLRAALTAAALGLAFSSAAPAQNYPTRTVEIVVPFAVGGSNDILARLLGEGLSKRLGQTFVPLNRPGANTNTGTLQVVKAAPDGYTLAMGTLRACRQSVALSEAAVRSAARSRSDHADRNRAGLLVVPPSLPVSTLGEFIAYLKAHPGELNYASYGVGSSPHLAAELFQSLTGTRLVHVPYSGGGPAAIGADGQQRADAVRRRAAGAGPDPRRPAQGDRARRRPALAAAARGADLHRGRPRLPHRSLVRAAGAGEDARADHRDAASGNGRYPAGPAMRARIAEQGADVVGSTPARIPRLHQGRDRALVGGDPEREYSPRLK